MKKTNNISIEAAMCPNDWEQGFLNIINSFDEEYFDDCYLPYINRQDFFLWLTKYRMYSIIFYPCRNYSEIFVVGDRFGTITGSLCDFAVKIDSYVPSMDHKMAVKHRYNRRTNLSVYSIADCENGNSNYKFGVVNLEFLHNFDSFTDMNHVKDTFHIMVNKAYEMLDDNGILLIYSMGNDLELLSRLFYEDGFIYQHSYDPLGNGSLVMEISRHNYLLSGLHGENLNISLKQEMLNSPWIRDNDYPFMGGEPVDQDCAIIEQVKPIILDLLDKLIEVCKKHDLTVYPIYGTLLGLIRNGHMIDGDDDIDVAMPREDYDKLMTLTEEFTGKYFLQTPYNDCCFYGGYSKLRNKETTAIHPQNWWKDCCEGIAIDIFPIDKCYKDENKELEKQKKIMLYQRLIYAKHYGYFPMFKDMPLLKWKKYVYLAKPFTIEQLLDKLHREMIKGNDASRVSIAAHYGNGQTNHVRYMPSKAFSKSIELLYENRRMSVPIGWHDILVGKYGEGYLYAASYNEWKQRHGFYDATLPYEIYKKRFGGLKHPETIKEPVVLIGEGRLFKACLSYYKSRVNISHLVILPGEERLKKSVDGIGVETWEEFSSLNIPKESYRAIICSGDAREAERILVEQGYSDYYIFWHERNWMLYANQSAVWKEIKKYS